MTVQSDQNGRSRQRYQYILRNRNIRSLLLADLASYFGNGLHWITLSWYILQATDSPFSVGISLVFTSLPNALMSPFAGVFVDRFNRRNVAVVMDFLRCISVLLIVPLTLLTRSGTQTFQGISRPEIWGIYLLTALISCADAFFAPAVFSLVPEITDKSYLTAVNSAINTVIQAGLLLGGALAGYLLTAFSPAVLFTANAVTFLVSGLFLVNIKYIPIISPTRSQLSVRSVTRDITAGVHYLAEHSLCAVLAFLFSINYVVLAVFNVLNPPLSINVLQAGSRGFGLMDAFIGVGALLAGFLAIYLTTHWGENVFLWVGYVCMALFAGLLGLTPNLSFGLVFAFMLGIGNTISGIVYSSVLQKTVANEYMGRVRSLVGLASTLLSSAVVLAYGYLAEQGFVRGSWILTGVVLALLSVQALLVSRRWARSRQSPSFAP